jgi:hypothetical protein
MVDIISFALEKPYRIGGRKDAAVHEKRYASCHFYPEPLAVIFFQKRIIVPVPDSPEKETQYYKKEGE